MKWLKYPGLWVEIKETSMKRQYLSFTQRVQIYNFIKTVGKVTGEYWEYNDKWSDQKVADQFKVSHGNVVTVRSELGRLQTYTGAPYAAKIRDLEAAIVRHEEHIADLYKKLSALEQRVSVLKLKEHFQA